MNKYLYVVNYVGCEVSYDICETSLGLEEATKQITKRVILDGCEHGDFVKDIGESIKTILVVPFNQHAYGDIRAVYDAHIEFHENLERGELLAKELAEYKRLQTKFEGIINE